MERSLAALKRSRLDYYRRIFSAYLGKRTSHLTFWHGTPLVNDRAPVDKLGEYYMPFFYKANYPGPFDDHGIPLLDYHGKIGPQYNPIAISQYALGHYNLFVRTSEQRHLDVFLRQADWLVANLETNPHGLRVWNHHFDWEYYRTLKAPWYSALSQGQGISALVRAHLQTGQSKYLDAARYAFEAFKYDTGSGGVKCTDDDKYVWLEETIVNPPPHILNGFLWALWGVRDYYLATSDEYARQLFADCVRTLRDNLHKFDLGFWSLYELSRTKLKMIASPFYHSLHIVQLKITHKLTGEKVFREFAGRWEGYQKNGVYRRASLIYKAVFKLLYY